MKIKLLFACLFALSLFTTGYAQNQYDIYFGSETNPDLILETTHPGYAAFVDAVADHIDYGSMTVNWDEVVLDIQSHPALGAYANWLDQQGAAAYVYIICCRVTIDTYCLVRIPYSCDQCECEKKKEDPQDPEIPILVGGPPPWI